MPEMSIRARSHSSASKHLLSARWHRRSSGNRLNLEFRCLDVISPSTKPCGRLRFSLSCGPPQAVRTHSHSVSEAAL